MSLITKKDVNLLLEAGFTEDDLGLVEGSKRGIEIYETPDDYFAKELIENACEAGECDLADEILPPDTQSKERYDNSRKTLYEDQEYPGGEDWLEGVPAELRAQAEWAKHIRLGRLSIWQRKSPKGIFEWPVKMLKVEIPEDDQERYNRLPKDVQKDLMRSYARDTWKKLWSICAYGLRFIPIEETAQVHTKNGLTLDLVVFSADTLREEGFKELPPEARWITMVYWEKDIERR